MATLVLDNAYLTVNSVDLSDHVVSVTLTTSADELDETAMGDSYRNRKGGLKDWSIQVTFHQDFAASKVDATLWPLLGSTTTVVVKAVNGAASATNPQYSGSVLVNDYSPLANSVGELATVSLTWPGAGTLARATS